MSGGRLPTQDDGCPIGTAEALAKVNDESGANNDFEKHNERYAYVRIAGLQRAY